MLLRLTHRTEYRYPYPSRDSHNELRLMPQTDATQTCRSFRVHTDPPTNVFHYWEPGGIVHHFGLRAPHSHLGICAEAVVETWLDNPFANLDFAQRNWAFYADPRVISGHIEFLAASPYVNSHAATRQIAEDVRTASDGSIVGFLLGLNQAIHDRMEYDADATHVHTTLDEIVRLEAGVCQDFTHLMLGCARSVGIPCRYVSGYLYVGEMGGMRGEQATHAWLECLMPDGQWVALDPTNNLLANDHYIRVHTGRDYSEVAPTRGVYIGAPAESLTVEVRVDRVPETSGSTAEVAVSPAGAQLRNAG